MYDCALLVSVLHGVGGKCHAPADLPRKRAPFYRNPSGCTMAMGSTQPLTEMGTRNISWG